MAEPLPPIPSRPWPRRLQGLLLALLLLIAAALLPPSPIPAGARATDLFRPAPAMATSELQQPVTASAGDGPVTQSMGNPEVVEQLRLKVPASAVEAWLEAERGSWEPWLAEQPGFVGRQMLWDAERQEGTLLIRWASRAQWQAIPAEAVAEVQDRFEALARQATGIPEGNPFPLVFEGELHPL